MPDTGDPLIRLAIAFAVIGLTTLLFLLGRLHYQALPKLPEAPETAPAPDCMVVIPARDEEANIGRAVKSFPPDTVIVVDDDSKDRTAAEAQKAGAGVLRAPALPRGSVGKAHACYAGARVLRSRWILFADADTWYERGFLRSLVFCAEASKVDFLSVHLRAEPLGFWQHILVPYAVALFYCGVNSRTGPTVAFGGHCVLALRQPYTFVGGHGALVRDVVEDVKLAALAERHRLKFALLRAPRMGHMRLHRGGGGLWSGLERNAFRFMIANTGMGIVILLTALLAAAWFPLSLWVLPESRIAAAVIALTPFLWLAGWYRGWRVILAPVAIYLFLPFALRAVLSCLVGKKVEWKGRIV